MEQKAGDKKSMEFVIQTTENTIKFLRVHIIHTHREGEWEWERQRYAVNKIEIIARISQRFWILLASNTIEKACARNRNIYIWFYIDKTTSDDIDQILLRVWTHRVITRFNFRTTIFNEMRIFSSNSSIPRLSFTFVLLIEWWLVHKL